MNISLFSTPSLNPEICFKMSFFSQWGMKTSSPSWLLVLHFFGYLLTPAGFSYCNGYNAKFMSLLQSCITSCKIRNVCPYCRAPKPLQGLDLQQIPERQEDKRDVTENTVEPHCKMKRTLFVSRAQWNTLLPTFNCPDHNSTCCIHPKMLSHT